MKNATFSVHANLVGEPECKLKKTHSDVSCHNSVAAAGMCPVPIRLLCSHGTHSDLEFNQNVRHVT